MYEKALKKFISIRDLIDNHEHPRARRAVYFVNWHVLMDDRSPEEWAQDIIENTPFWEWFNREYRCVKSADVLENARAIYNAFDPEDR